MVYVRRITCNPNYKWFWKWIWVSFFCEFIQWNGTQYALTNFCKRNVFDSQLKKLISVNWWKWFKNTTEIQLKWTSKDSSIFLAKECEQIDVIQKQTLDFITNALARRTLPYFFVKRPKQKHNKETQHHCAIECLYCDAF